MIRYTYQRKDNYQGAGATWDVYRLDSKSPAPEFICACGSEEIAAWLVQIWNEQEKKKNA